MSSSVAFALMPFVAGTAEALVDRFLLPQATRLRIKTEGKFIAVSAFLFAGVLVAAVVAYDYVTVHDLYPELAVFAALLGGGIGVVRGSNRWDRLQREVVSGTTAQTVR